LPVKNIIHGDFLNMAVLTKAWQREDEDGGEGLQCMW